MNMEGRPNGNGRQLCCRVGCGLKSIAGLANGQGMCPYHWAEYHWGAEYANKCHPIKQTTQPEKLGP